MMKNSVISPDWLREQMTKNPPSLRDNGEIFSGPVRLCFPNLYTPGKQRDGSLGKFGAVLLFPLGTDMSIFEREWLAAAHAAFPKDWDDQGKPIKLHFPIHDQREKAFGTKVLMGYTPGAFYFSATSNYKPTVVDTAMRPLLDESKVYPGVWAFVSLNIYSYDNINRGVSFGIQTVMIIADDTKLSGGGSDPNKAFGHVQISAQSNIAAKFDSIGGAQKPAAGPSLMPSGGHVGQAGGFAVQQLPSAGHSLEDLM